MDNTVIEVLNFEHGNKVIEWFKSQGVNTKGYIGSFTKEDNDDARFYGFINGVFSCYSFKRVIKKNAAVITLPEETYPRKMMVSDDGENWFNGIVYGKIDLGYVIKLKYYLFFDNTSFVVYKYAKEIEPVKTELTIPEVEQKLNLPAGSLRIKK